MFARCYPSYIVFSITHIVVVLIYALSFTVMNHPPVLHSVCLSVTLFIVLWTLDIRLCPVSTCFIVHSCCS